MDNSAKINGKGFLGSIGLKSLLPTMLKWPSWLRRRNAIPETGGSNPSLSSNDFMELKEIEWIDSDYDKNKVDRWHKISEGYIMTNGWYGIEKYVLCHISFCRSTKEERKFSFNGKSSFYDNYYVEFSGIPKMSLKPYSDLHFFKRKKQLNLNSVKEMAKNDIDVHLKKMFFNPSGTCMRKILIEKMKT